MGPLVTEALVLRAVDFGESDRILHLLTPEIGRVTAIAKGARRSRRRFAGTLDFFNHLRVQLERRRPSSMARLESATLLASFDTIRRHTARFGLGCYLLELLDRLAPEGGARGDVRRLFAFALAALRAIERGEPDLRLRTFLELRALDALGLCPELRRCVRCGTELGRPPAEPAAAGRGAAFGFHVAEGGPVCGACGARLQGLLPVQLGTLRALEQGLRFELDALGRLALAPVMLDEAARLVRRFGRFHLGVELRSERFLDEIMGSARAITA